MNTDLLEQYKNCINRALDSIPGSPTYVECYKEADLLEKRIKTEVVKTVYQAIEEQLDQLDELIRRQKFLNKTDA